MSKISALSNEIFLSRDALRAQLVEELKEYLNLVDVDLTKSSFISYIINILATLTSNILFYQISVYKEFFLTKAQLNHSVIDLAAGIGYNPNMAHHASLNLILTFPFRFTDEEVIFRIPKYSQFFVNNISFIIDYDVKVIVQNNSIVKAYKYTDNNSENIIVYIDYLENTFNLLLLGHQYNVEKFEFSVYQNNLEYQFTEYEILLNGQLSKIEVKVVEPGNDIEYIYNQYSSIYLMSPSDRGFVVRKSDNGQKIYFGNGLIGYQPPANSIIYITAFTTLGEQGNIIKGSNFNQPELFGRTNTGEHVTIKYTVTNESAADGGKNEPTLEEVKYKAIDNLSALYRLVSENDYKKINSIIEDVPLSTNTFPVLKRSDIRTNEIQVFSILSYQGKMIPTENVFLNINPDSCQDILDCTSAENIIKINKNQEVEYDGDRYIIPFDLEINTNLEVTRYKYIVTSIIYAVNLVSTGVSIEDYNLFATNVLIETKDKKAFIKIFFQTDETDFDVVTCRLEISNTLIRQDMQINTLGKYFEISFDSYNNLPENEESYYFTFSHPTQGRLNQYSIDLIFRKNLDHIMLSNTIVDDNDNITVYDIPVIQKEYYDSLVNKSDFEYYVFHKMISNIEFSDTRMLTDFVNIKFANTSKKLRNMILNKETKLPVDYINLEYLDHIPELNNRYIITGTELPEWKDKVGYIATCTEIDSTSNEITWTYTKPEMDEIVYAYNTQKKYLYTSCDWIEPIYDIPLKIELDIRVKDNYVSDIQKFIDIVKNTLVTEFSDRMVCQSHLSRSEIISTVQQIDGVDHCKLLKPSSNIFYNFKLEDLTEEELLKYTPELLYFSVDDITIRLVN